VKNSKKKLIVMIPCFNEEKTLPAVINSIPKKIPGISKIETLVVDDGSTDSTVQVAKKLKVDYIITHHVRKGLAQAFATGLDVSLEKGADIIVNTDGDNQYPQKDIHKLIRPILDGRADIVIGDRQTDKIRYFSPIKKFLQRLGSRMVRLLSDTEIPDAASGFRARSREAALQTNIVTDFSYTLETIIQAGKKKIAITSVPITVNPKTRNSRLYDGIWSYLKGSGATMIRVFAMYEPLKTFLYVGSAIFLLGFILFVRAAYLFITDTGGGHIQSLILAVLFVLIGFQIGLIGLVADLIAGNRKLLEKILYDLRKNKYSKK
jgi:glycosyltransferase involved in cell wall biosynthesis